jgi:hypothetical protein
METDKNQWSKEELKTYILLLCAKADLIASEAELNLIKSKTAEATFEKMHKEFCKDDEDTSLEKIQGALERHEYSTMELAALRSEIQQVFSTDNNVNMKERNLGWVLDNILY